MNRYFWKIFHLVNKIFIKGFKSVGWCYMSYRMNKDGFHIVFDEGDEWYEPPQNPISAWRGAFLYPFRKLE